MRIPQTMMRNVGPVPRAWWPACSASSGMQAATCAERAPSGPWCLGAPSSAYWATSSKCDQSGRCPPHRWTQSAPPSGRGPEWCRREQVRSRQRGRRCRGYMTCRDRLGRWPCPATSWALRCRRFSRGCRAALPSVRRRARQFDALCRPCPSMPARPRLWKQAWAAGHSACRRSLLLSWLPRRRLHQVLLQVLHPWRRRLPRPTFRGPRWSWTSESLCCCAQQ
mmetsp:Transcript_103031/g.245408  ORF Transcript_103031/g.245408 Transcript_103031/m.245408 type:complete len:223 (-) Transcript_103031:617-1285(-)